MPRAELADDVRSQVAKIREMVFNVCEIDSTTGKITAKPGTTREQILFAVKAIKQIESIYKERIVDLDSLNAELDAHEESVRKTSEKIDKFTSRFGTDIFPKWLLKAYKR